jgi:lysophospholipase L1-like esterase
VNPTLGSNTLNITRTAGEVDIGAIYAYNSASKEISVMNFGYSGALLSDLTSTTYAWSNLNMLGTIAPNLTIIMPGINDWNAGTSLSTYKSELTTLINKAALSGNVLLISAPPSEANTNGNASWAAQWSYVSATRDVAFTSGIGFIDGWAGFYNGNWTSMNTNGYSFDNKHPNGTGYGVVATNVLAGMVNGLVSY